MALTLSSAPALSRSNSLSFRRGLDFSPGPSAKPPLFASAPRLQATHHDCQDDAAATSLPSTGEFLAGLSVCFEALPVIRPATSNLRLFFSPPRHRSSLPILFSRRGLLESRRATGDLRPFFVPYLTLFAGAGRTPRSEDHHLVAVLADSGPSPSILYVLCWSLQRRISSCCYSFPNLNLQCYPVSSPVVTHLRLSLLLFRGG